MSLEKDLLRKNLLISIVKILQPLSATKKFSLNLSHASISSSKKMSLSKMNWKRKSKKEIEPTLTLTNEYMTNTLYTYFHLYKLLISKYFFLFGWYILTNVVFPNMAGIQT